MKIKYLIFASILTVNLFAQQAPITIELNQNTVNEIKQNLQKSIDYFQQQKKETEGKLRDANLKEADKIKSLADIAGFDAAIKSMESWIKTYQDEIKKVEANTQKPVRLTL